MNEVLCALSRLGVGLLAIVGVLVVVGCIAAVCEWSDRRFPPPEYPLWLQMAGNVITVTTLVIVLLMGCFALGTEILGPCK